jgi:hypothetical protein
MSPDGRSTIVKRIKLFAVIGGLLVVAAACSSNGLTCGDGNRSNTCLASSDRHAGETTGSIQAQRAMSRDTAGSAPPRIARPAVVRSPPQWRQPNSMTARRQLLTRKRMREARLRRSVTCDVTGSIPRDTARSVVAARPSMSLAGYRRLTRPIVHTVAPGETLYAIARRYRTSVTAIANFNVIRQTAHIKSGDTILVPIS